MTRVGMALDGLLDGAGELLLPDHGVVDGLGLTRWWRQSQCRNDHADSDGLLIATEIALGAGDCVTIRASPTTTPNTAANTATRRPARDAEGSL
jgi:hypothetical protein